MDQTASLHTLGISGLCFHGKNRFERKPYYGYITAGANKFFRIYYGQVREYLASLEESKES